MKYPQQFTMKKGIASHHQGSVTLQQLSETLEVKGILLWNHPSLFAVNVRSSGRKGGFARESPFIVCSRCQKPRQERGICLRITLHCVQQVSETQAGKGD